MSWHNKDCFTPGQLPQLPRTSLPIASGLGNLTTFHLAHLHHVDLLDSIAVSLFRWSEEIRNKPFNVIQCQVGVKRSQVPQFTPMQSQSGNLIQLGMTLLLTITCITCFTFTYASGSKAESGAGLLGAGRCANLCQVAPSQGCIQCWEVFLQLNLCNWLHWAAKYGWG